jgi:hypothetical protein
MAKAGSLEARKKLNIQKSLVHRIAMLLGLHKLPPFEPVALR